MPVPARSAADLRADYETAMGRREQDRLRLGTVEELLHKLNTDLEDLTTRTTQLLDLAARTAVPR
jgi:hypothetical protein